MSVPGTLRSGKVRLTPEQVAAAAVAIKAARQAVAAQKAAEKAAVEQLAGLFSLVGITDAQQAAASVVQASEQDLVTAMAAMGLGGQGGGRRRYRKSRRHRSRKHRKTRRHH
jgi:hypothetical protein